MPKSRARGAREGDGAPPAPHFPTPAVSKGLSCKFTMALALRLVNDTPRYVEAQDNRIGVRSSKICWLPEISLLLLLFPAWSGAGQVGRRGEQEDWRCKFPTLGLLFSCPAGEMEQSRACNLLTLQVVGRESAGGRDHAACPPTSLSEETLAGCSNTSQENTAAGKISPGHV